MEKYREITKELKILMISSHFITFTMGIALGLAISLLLLDKLGEINIFYTIPCLISGLIIFSLISRIIWHFKLKKYIGNEESKKENIS